MDCLSIWRNYVHSFFSVITLGYGRGTVEMQHRVEECGEE
jgi:hypothetical protein